MQIQEYTVSQISARIKHLMESNYEYVRIRGEISGLKVASSGHGYFNLKDDNAIIAATCWRSVLSKLKAKPCDGLEVIVSGKITTYAGQSRYQISVEHIEHAGIGALMQILNERKNKLQLEGLFDSERKKNIPFFPRIIGVVTSITGAVIKDIIHRIEARCATRVIIWPVTVQGEDSASEVVAAIDGFNKVADHMRPDILIIARGGGSIEDLWSFNEENVVRAIAASNIPIISAIGHETDFTLADFVADIRAPTPTAAAEIATPVISQLRITINDNYSRIISIIENKLRNVSNILNAYDVAMHRPRSLTARLIQKIDDVTFALDASIQTNMRYKDITMRQHKVDASKLLSLVKLRATEILYSENNLKLCIHRIVDKLNSEYVRLTSILESIDYRKTLRRGFAVIRRSNKLPIMSVLEVRSGEELDIEVVDGIIKTTVR